MNHSGGSKPYDHPSLRVLRYTARPFGDETGKSVGLLKLAVGSVEEDRLSFVELMAEDATQPRI
jgi:hypothetical protein